MKNFIVPLLFILSVLFVSSCGEDAVTPDLCNATLFNEDINPKLAAWQEATMEYANDQSVANCNNYKSTGQEWLESIRRYEGCATLYTQSWREAVDEAMADLAAVPCN